MGLTKIDIAYLVLLAANVMGIILSYIFKSSIDIHLHDTMFVFSTSFFWKVLFLYNLLLFATNHLLVQIKGRTVVFQWIFYFATVVFTILIYATNEFLTKPVHYLGATFFRTFDDFEFYNGLLMWSIVLLVAFHALFWLYSILTILRHLVLKRRFDNQKH